MSRLRFVLTAAAALAAPAVLAAGAHAAAPTSSLYLQQAKSGSLHGDTLVLRGVSPQTTRFADRPARTAGSLTTRGFVSGWKGAFGDDPPNAALEIAGAPRSRDVALLELRGAPRYDAAAHTLTYRVRQLRTTSAKTLGPLAARADQGVRDFGAATLFIDDGSTEVLATFQVTIPSGGTTVAVNAGNFTFDFNALNLGGSMLSASAGIDANLDPDAFELTFQGPQEFVGVSVLTGLVVGSATSLTGNATIPGGASLSVTINGVSTTIPNGAFSVPLPS
jgi:hypothetical protein